MSEPTHPVQLQCSIVGAGGSGASRWLDYVVTDEHGIVVAEGSSSNAEWVKHDAGGYHTKENFDERFPQGWQVNFNF